MLAWLVCRAVLFFETLLPVRGNGDESVLVGVYAIETQPFLSCLHNPAIITHGIPLSAQFLMSRVVNHTTPDIQLHLPLVCRLELKMNVQMLM
jgi:hypothetical protein